MSSRIITTCISKSYQHSLKNKLILINWSVYSFPQKNSELLNFSNHSFYPVCCLYISIYIYIYPIIPFIQFPSPPLPFPSIGHVYIYIYIQNTHTRFVIIYTIFHHHHRSGTSVIIAVDHMINPAATLPIPGLIFSSTSLICIISGSRCAKRLTIKYNGNISYP